MAEILYFGALKEQVGRAGETLALPAGVTTLKDLVAHMRSRGAPFDAAFESSFFLRAAINQVHADLDAAITDEDEIAFFPPVTGG